MRYLKLYENFNDSYIHEICEKYGIKNYTINEDGTIDVDGHVDLYRKKLTELPLNFKNVSGFFNCNNNQLTSLKGCPKSIKGDFNCSSNKLTSLEYCPEFVGGFFYCSNNKLTSLEYCTKSVSGGFYCIYNYLTSLEYCPEYINDIFDCSGNQLTSLKFMPKCNKFVFDNNKIRDFKYFVEPYEHIYCTYNPIYAIWELFMDKSHIELLNDYDCIRGEDIIIDRLNQFLEEIDKPTVESVEEYNNI